MTGIFQAATGIKHTHTIGHLYISAHSCLTTSNCTFSLHEAFKQLIVANDTRHTHQILDQLRVRNEGLRVCVYGVSAVLNLSQCFKVAQQNIAEPLGIHAWDLPLLCLFILEPNRSKRDDTRQKSYSAQADMVKNQRISLRVKKVYVHVRK